MQKNDQDVLSPVKLSPAGFYSPSPTNCKNLPTRDPDLQSFLFWLFLLIDHAERFRAFETADLEIIHKLLQALIARLSLHGKENISNKESDT